MGQIKAQGLTDGGKGDIIEERARHYIRGEHGYFMGSFLTSGISGSCGGQKSLDKSVGSCIMVEERKFDAQ
ncbi:MAG: hypothetical protein ACI4Q4_00860 [Oscillospiraceae bacterium]